MFARGEWMQLLLASRDCCDKALSASIRRRRTQHDSLERRAERAEETDFGRARSLGKGPVPARGSVSARLCVPARAVLALLLPVVAERAGCVPTWMVQAGGCGSVTEIAERSGGRRGAALTCMPCKVHKWASMARPGGGAYCSSPGGGCSKTRGAKVRT